MVIQQVEENPESVIVFPTGSTPLEMYRFLREAYKDGVVSFTVIQDVIYAVLI